MFSSSLSLTLLTPSSRPLPPPSALSSQPILPTTTSLPTNFSTTMPLAHPQPKLRLKAHGRPKKLNKRKKKNGAENVNKVIDMEKSRTTIALDYFKEKLMNHDVVNHQSVLNEFKPVCQLSQYIEDGRVRRRGKGRRGG
ncbi:hypothetical protein HN51_048623 [Arachis hypogaea]